MHAVRLEHARRLTHRRRRVLHIDEGLVRDHEIERGVIERQIRGVGDEVSHYRYTWWPGRPRLRGPVLGLILPGAVEVAICSARCHHGRSGTQHHAEAGGLDLTRTSRQTSRAVSERPMGPAPQVIVTVPGAVAGGRDGRDGRGVSPRPHGRCSACGSVGLALTHAALGAGACQRRAAAGRRRSRARVRLASPAPPRLRVRKCEYRPRTASVGPPF